ncbi:SixA phosphatase family protein [Galbibacter mesophilus]|uniref:SixA phosphatase family protein n=1 Tax=Galbibacter mesophilus TaxID=379069 RepID=UPI00191CCB9D|nr:histidine phosphatase family protein [Galbibacter mesophilus]MCM5663037.1 histidine phosphatase family protein [Galbibacter mesophilus]
MKSLTLMRHGKSSWDFEVRDKDRPLQERGVNDAILVAQTVKVNLTTPDIIFSSPAARALHTCMIFVRESKLDLSKVKITEELYDFDGDSVITFLKSLDERYKNVMIFGHNHAFTSISNIFGNKSIDNLPTAGLVTLHFDVEKWSDIKQGTTEKIIFPKQLK